MGFVALAALGAQAFVLVQADMFNAVNFFGYFTNLSNIVAALLLIVSAAYVYKSRKPSATDDLVRGAATLYMVITGVVYALLLTGEDVGLLLPWVNSILHVVMPVVVVADWLYQPPRTKLMARHILWWLLFPAMYLVYTLLRGAIVGWYPYPFLDPDKIGGYGGVALYACGILLAFFCFGWLLMRLGASLKRHVS